MRKAIDLDTFIYRCGFAAETKNYLLENTITGTFQFFENKRELNAYLKEKNRKDQYCVWTEHKVEPVEHAIANLRSSLRRVHEVCGEGESLLYLSGKHCFREDLATIRPYKGNRDPDYKPVHYAEMRRYAVEQLGAIVCDGIEADDAVAIAATENPETVIVSNDKDLRQIPGWHWDWTKDDKPEQVDKKAAALFFYRQVLTGDSTDNIEGVPGLGPAGAGRVLDGVSSPKDAERRVYQVYKEKFGAEEGLKRLIENARLVRILRSVEEKDEPWVPRYLESRDLNDESQNN